jgi:pimeloyl-ACP methyl ester carboxylesterase
LALQTSAETQFYFEEHGVGEPLVLISGYAANHAFWTPLLGKLAQQYRVIIFDNPGMGDTFDKGGPLTIRDMAHRIATFLSDIDVERAHVVGHSMGGSLAICLAALHPKRVKKLVLLNSYHRLRALSRHVLTNLLNLRLADVKLFTLLNAMIPWFFSNESIQEGKRPAELVDFFVKNQNLQSISNQSRQLDAAMAFNAEDWLAEITAETLILAGDADLLAPVEDAEVLHDGIRHSTLKTLPAAHNMPQEIPKEIASELLGFLAGPRA